MVDLHLHTRYSDGDWSVVEVVAEAARRGLSGISITDHNGIWGVVKAAQAAHEHGLSYVQGIEVTARYQQADVHMVGFARSFNEKIMTEGLSATRAGYEARVREMVARCQQQGFKDVSFAAIEAARAEQVNPSYISYDVASQLMEKYGLPWEKVRTLITRGGTCYVPYGDWALTPLQVIDLFHRAGGKALIAHPGIIVHEAGRALFDQLLEELLPAALDGIEVYHPFHDQLLTQELQKFCDEHSLVVSGGSDWHGPNRYHHGAFGQYGIDDAAFERLVANLA